MKKNFSYGARKPKSPDEETFDKVLGAYQGVARDEIVKDFGLASCVSATRITIDVLNHYKIEAIPMSVDVVACNATFRERLAAGDDPPENPELGKEWRERTGAYAVGIGEWVKLMGGYAISDVCTIKKFLTGLEAEKLLGVTRPELMLVEDTTFSDLDMGDVVLADGRGFMMQEGPGGIPMLYPVHVGHVVAYLPEKQTLVDAAANQLNRPEHKIELPGVLLVKVRSDFIDSTHGAVEEVQVESEVQGSSHIFYKRVSNDTYQEGEIWFDKRITKRTREAICASIDSRLNLAVK